MVAERVLMDRADPAEAFERCREVISAGGSLIYPTDTFYGLGVDPGNRAAVERLFQIKGREADQPVLLLVHDSSEVRKWADSVSVEAERLMARHWPGPLTLVFPAHPRVLPMLTGGTGTIGIRVPGNAVTRQLLAFLGQALTGTSANRAGQQPALTAPDALASLGDKVDLVLDDGPTAGGRPSTVAEIRNDRIVVIREGAVSL